MKYTVIGPNGFIGQKLVQKLKAENQDVICIEKHQELRKDQDYGVIFYCAGIKNDFDKKLFDIVEAHVSKLSQWINNAQFSHFVYLSSTRVYANQSHGIEDERNFHLNTDDLYNLTKILGETICLKAAKNITIARLANVLGYEPNSQTFLWSLLNQAKLNNCLHIEEDQYMSRDYILLDEAIYSLIQLAQHKATGVYNLASGKLIQNKQIVEIINHNRILTNVKFGSKLIPFPIFSTEKLFETINFRFSNPTYRISNLAKYFFNSQD